MSVSLRIARQRQKLLAKQNAQGPTKTFPPWDINAFLFREQLAFVHDPARFSTAVCSVRAGKTTACAADLIDTALKMPNTIGCYITLARSSAERIVWPELKKINRDYNLKAFPNEAKLSLVFPNGSTIYLMGGNDEQEIEKIRGLSNVALVYIDECQSFRQHIKELVEDIVTKRLYDTNGRCRMIGTPGPVLSGYFYDATEGNLKDGWSHHHWTMHTNPWLLKKSGKTPDELIAQDCARKGVSLDDPSIQRECFGRWKLDPNALLLTYDPSVNHYDTLPSAKYTYILGVDLGQRDLNFLSLIAFTASSPVTYLVEEKYTQNQLTDDLAKDIRSMLDKYPMAMVVVDAGGQGLAIVEDMKARHGLPLQAADKKGKLSNYALLNNALRTGNFKAKTTSVFAKDCNILERDDDRSTPDRVVVKGHSDAVDATLYAFRHSPAYNYTPIAVIPKLGTPEYDFYTQKQLMDHHIEKLQKEQANKQGRDIGSWDTDSMGIPSWNHWED